MEKKNPSWLIFILLKELSGLEMNPEYVKNWVKRLKDFLKNGTFWEF